MTALRRRHAAREALLWEPRVAPGDAERAEVRRMLERLLLENVIPFWYPAVIDERDGGYRLNHDGAGRWRGPAPRRLVTQARTVWFFARLARSPYAAAGHREAAAHGYRFLRERMWDPAHGGFYWEVDAPGTAATDARKDLVGQTFGLYAACEYAHLTADGGDRAFAGEIFRLWETKAHDAVHGGYYEDFDREWRRREPPIKSMNIHLHLLEAIAEYVRLSGDPLARTRLIELILVQSGAVMRNDRAVSVERHTAAWSPADPADQVVSYGHDLENIWLLIDAVAAAGLPNGPMLDLYRGIFAYAHRFAFDDREGGFFTGGAMGRAATDRRKVWWVQAEGMLAALHLHRLTGAAVCWQVFRATLDWITRYQADWTHGEWHAHIMPDGRPDEGDKAGPWKSPYHNGRALLACLALLDAR